MPLKTVLNWEGGGGQGRVQNPQSRSSIEDPFLLDVKSINTIVKN